MPRSIAVGVVLTVVSACAFGSGALFAKPVYAAGVGWHVLACETSRSEPLMPRDHL